MEDGRKTSLKDLKLFLNYINIWLYDGRKFIPSRSIISFRRDLPSIKAAFKEIETGPQNIY